MGSAEDSSNASDDGQPLFEAEVEYVVDDDARSDASSDSISSCTSSASSDMPGPPIWGPSEGDLGRMINNLRQEYDAHQGQELTRPYRQEVHGFLLEQLQASANIRRALDLMQGRLLKDLVLFLIDEVSDGREGRIW